MINYDAIKRKLHAQLPSNEQDIVIICIGTDRNIGDSLGPFIGNILSEKNLPRTYIYGTIDAPVTALNIANVAKEAQKKHPDAFFIGIDAALGEDFEVGDAYVQNHPIRPGLVVGKKLPLVGDISIIGIVNERFDNAAQNSFSLATTRLSFVLKMAKKIALVLEHTICEHFTGNVVPLYREEPTPTKKSTSLQ